MTRIAEDRLPAIPREDRLCDGTRAELVTGQMLLVKVRPGFSLTIRNLVGDPRQCEGKDTAGVSLDRLASPWCHGPVDVGRMVRRTQHV